MIDTDPGIDDAAALAIALFHPDLDVKLITTVAGNVSIEKTTANALKLIEMFGKDVPIARGCEHPLVYDLDDGSEVHGITGMDGWVFPEPDYSRLMKEHAVIAMRDLLMESPEEITLVAIGPLTNVGMLFRLFPEVKAKINEIVLMGGSVTRGNKTPTGEFNIYSDPEAAHIVFTSGLPIRMVGLDVGWKSFVDGKHMDMLPEINKVCEMLEATFRHYRSNQFEKGIVNMYDSDAIAALVKPEMFKWVNTHLDVELEGKYGRGQTVCDLDERYGKAHNVTVAVDVSTKVFQDWFIESLKNCNI